MNLLLIPCVLALRGLLGNAPQAIDVPVDVGVGPTANFFSGPVGADQLVHSGIRLDIAGVIDAATIRAHAADIPAEYRGPAESFQEIRYSPCILIPDQLFLSPMFKDTAMYGVGWKPFEVALAPIRSQTVRLDLGAGLLVTYIYLYSRALAAPETNFLRPGAGLRAELTVALGKSLLVSGGWESQFYPPQALGAPVFSWGPLDQSIWHIGQAFVMLHGRFPHRTVL